MDGSWEEIKIWSLGVIFIQENKKRLFWWKPTRIHNAFPFLFFNGHKKKGSLRRKKFVLKAIILYKKKKEFFFFDCLTKRVLVMAEEGLTPRVRHDAFIMRTLVPLLFGKVAGSLLSSNDLLTFFTIVIWVIWEWSPSLTLPLPLLFHCQSMNSFFWLLSSGTTFISSFHSKRFSN